MISGHFNQTFHIHAFLEPGNLKKQKQNPVKLVFKNKTNPEKQPKFNKYILEIVFKYLTLGPIQSSLCLGPHNRGEFKRPDFEGLITENVRMTYKMNLQQGHENNL